MSANQAIHAFAVKWFDVFCNTKTAKYEVEESTFAEECFSLGFDIDCEKAFEAAYPKCNAFNDYRELDKIIDSIDDIYLLGSAIFSKWHYLIHSAGADEDILTFENRSWFITALSRLKHLSADTRATPFHFAGSANKVKLISNNLGYGPFPAPNNEVEQHLTITADGRVFFSAYTYGDVIKNKRSRTTNFRIASDKAAFIVKMIADYFSDDYNVVIATDVGNWEMTLTNEEGTPYRFRGSLCSGCSHELDNYSDIIRLILDMPELFVFDGCADLCRIEKLSIDYHRVTKIKKKSDAIPAGLAQEYVTWDYSEHLIIDRKAETLEHIQSIGSTCQVSQKYHVDGGVSSLLDDLDAEALFAHTEGNSLDVISNPLETKDYRITIDYLNGEQKLLIGTFDKNGLPDDFSDFAEMVFDFMRFFGLGEILDPSVHGKVLRKQNDLIFCNVQFNRYGKTYCYLTDDDTLKAGDRVVVPVGQENHESVARIESIEYHSPEEAPFPIEKTKKIIRKAKGKENDTDTDTDAVAMASKMPHDITPKKWRDMLGEDYSDEALATALAGAWNKRGSLGHELDDDDCTQEKVSEHDAWWTLEKELIAEVARRMNQECEMPYAKLITPFMERNGYKAACGWWVKKEEEKQDSKLHAEHLLSKKD